MKKPRNDQQKNHMRPHVWRLYSGIFRCPSCGVELELRHVRDLECPECGERGLEQLPDEQDQREESERQP